MKFTEGAFKDWGYELARDEFSAETISEDELWDEYDGIVPEGKIVIKDRIADNMLQQLITRTADYDVIATLNLERRLYERRSSSAGWRSRYGARWQHRRRYCPV